MLRLIALFRWSKALVLIGAAFGAMRLLRPGAAQRVAQWAMQLPIAAQHRFVSQAVAKLTRLDTTKVPWIVAGLFAYAALFAAEGFGLWLEKRWGEWLTIVATTSFIPFEAYELWRRATAVRGAMLVANVAIVIYLLWRIRRHGRGKGHGTRHAYAARSSSFSSESRLSSATSPGREGIRRDSSSTSHRSPTTR
ncbi:MAG TPA: DUF2127 domain-containing protein [Thermoanaerobaculia bacterium]